MKVSLLFRASAIETVDLKSLGYGDKHWDDLTESEQHEITDPIIEQMVGSLERAHCYDDEARKI